MNKEDKKKIENRVVFLKKQIESNAKIIKNLELVNQRIHGGILELELALSTTVPPAKKAPAKKKASPKKK